MLEMLSDPPPVLVSVKLCAALVVPTAVPPLPALNVAMTEVRASEAEDVAVAVCVPKTLTVLSSENASVADPVFGVANPFEYPLPAVQVPDPLSRAKYPNTNSFGDVVGPAVTTEAAVPLDWKLDPIWSSTAVVSNPDTSYTCKCRLLVPVICTVTVSAPAEGATA